ncbi:MAG TPA: UDP-N-acetylglucosamine 2-epimerase (non-hydrolyzing) [Bacillota bacterium]|nr:UDP-N-acetylglucosamine 2-epimerase (non-hydrolyzing) [Bacillota bacterium]HPZ11685.1 UDP-N-acetylglucosamine 2-epimerase (non-hydrolyzing) [Bacillota bacterium]HQE10998.1 UDP-N-acetylglucosamine 2-epimerase (non-hydrolyzing) [Bacillota bacterium]
MHTVLSVFGTRPEAIKMAPLIRILKETTGIRTLTAVTAQHREMLDQVLALFEIRPEYDLDLMSPRQTLTEITCRALAGLEQVLVRVKPDLVLVHGDTTTTFAAALSSFYHGVAVGHVEAGLRTFNKRSPFPEELNRRLTGSLADLHFAPTARARENLLREGIPADTIFVTGNTVIDALQTTVRPDFTFPEPLLNRIDFSRPVLLAEVHRRENWGEPLEAICRAFRRLVDDLQLPLIFPVHRNPVVRETVERLLSNHESIHLLEPLDTASFHNLMQRCRLVLTDSGGIQEEAPSLGRPVLVLRDITERPEAVEAGTVKVVGTAEEAVYSAARHLLENPAAYDAMARAINPYGDGRAARRIREALLYHFGLRPDRPADFSPGSSRD